MPPSDNRPVGSACGAGDEGGDDVGGVRSNDWRGPVVAHGCSGIDMTGRLLQIAERDPGVQGSVEWQVEYFAELPVLVVCCLRWARAPLVPTPPVVQSSFYGSIYPSVHLLLAARAMASVLR
jgi:hypothetical protein